MDVAVLAYDGMTALDAVGPAQVLAGMPGARVRWVAAEPVADRVVVDGKLITGAGVSAGIDLALRLLQTIAGDAVAQTVQLAIEYDPAPPFSAGSPKSAPPDVLEAARRALSRASA